MLVLSSVHCTSAAVNFVQGYVQGLLQLLRLIPFWDACVCSVRMSALALLKIAMHARSGGSIEVSNTAVAGMTHGYAGSSHNDMCFVSMTCSSCLQQHHSCSWCNAPSRWLRRVRWLPIACFCNANLLRLLQPPHCACAHPCRSWACSRARSKMTPLL